MKASIRSRSTATGAARLRRILPCAKEQFALHGYLAATIAGHDKKPLMLAVLKEFRNQTLKRYKSETKGIKSPLQRLYAISDMFLKSTRDLAVEYRILHRALAEIQDPDIVAVLRAYYIDLETLLASIIALGQRTGVFRRSIEPRVGAWELIRTSLGYTSIARLDIPLHDEPDYPSRAVDCMLQCLLKTDV